MSIVITIMTWALGAMFVMGFVFYFLVKHKVPIMRPSPPRPPKSTPIANTMFPWVIGNFAVYFLFSSLIGGDAVNGHSQGGKHFVANHGNITKVSGTVWTINLIHTYLTILSFVGLIIVQGLEQILRKRPETEEQQD